MTGKLTQLVDWLRTRRKRLRKVGLVLAISIFALGFFFAWENIPANSLRIRFELLIPYALFLPPFTYFLQSLELMLNARAADARLSRREAMEIVLYANVATYLPIPGGLLTRTAALKIRGVSLVRSTSVVLLFTGLAGTVSFAYAGMWAIWREPQVGIVALLLALCGAISCAIIARHATVLFRIVFLETALRLITTIYESACLVLIFAAIGTTITFSQSAILVVSGFIAMALTIFPSGFGVRESIVALLSPLVGIDPATGFLAAATARVVAMGWMALLAVIVLTLNSRD